MSLKLLIESINYDRFEIILITKNSIEGFVNIPITNNIINDIITAKKYVSNDSKYLLLLNSNMILTNQMIYDLVLFSKHNNYNLVKSFLYL